MRRIRILRVLCFAAIYFSIQLTYAVFFAIRTYSATQEAAWYLQHPLETLQKIFFELTHSPHSLFLLTITLLGMTTYALLLGLATDLILTLLQNRLSRKPS